MKLRHGDGQPGLIGDALNCKPYITRGSLDSVGIKEAAHSLYWRSSDNRSSAQTLGFRDKTAHRAVVAPAHLAGAYGGDGRDGCRGPSP